MFNSRLQVKKDLAKPLKRQRVRKRYERFDEKFAKSLEDPKFCEEFDNFFINHIQQKPVVKSNISIQEPKSETEFKKPLQPAQSRLKMIRARKKLTVIIPRNRTRN